MTRGGFTDDQFAPFAPPPPSAPGAPPVQQAPPPPPAIVISHRIWQNLYNSDEHIIGRSIQFAETPGTIVGVAHRDFEIVQIDRLGHEVEGAAVHRRANVGHVAVRRNNDRANRRLTRPQFGKQGQPVHHRHVDVEKQKLDIGLPLQHGERFLAMVREAEGEFVRPDLAAKSLPDQLLEIDFVIDREDADSAGSVRSLGIEVLAAQTVMRSMEDRVALARAVLEFAAAIREKRALEVE